jgi:cytochrome c-type biogenesis protein CcmH
MTVPRVGVITLLPKGLALAVLLGFSIAAHAVQPDEILSDTALEARARALSAELRCLVCQNQSIDDSDAPLARDLRILVRERLKAGDSDAAVKAFVVARYGDFVLLRPPFATRTLLLWVLPFAVLLGGLAFAYAAAQRVQQRGSERAAQSKLTEEEEARLAGILADSDDKRPHGAP